MELVAVILDAEGGGLVTILYCLVTVMHQRTPYTQLTLLRITSSFLLH